MVEALTQPGTSIPHSKLEEVLAVVLEEAIDDAVQLAFVAKLAISRLCRDYE